jgi:hypothetical protein
MRPKYSSLSYVWLNDSLEASCAQQIYIYEIYTQYGLRSSVICMHISAYNHICTCTILYVYRYVCIGVHICIYLLYMLYI